MVVGDVPRGPTAPGSVATVGASVCEVLCCVCPVFVLSAGGVGSNERTVTGLCDGVAYYVFS